MASNYPCIRKSEIVVQETKDEVLVYDLRNHKAHSLNSITAFIWENCDGKKSSEEIAEMVESNFSAKCDEDLVKLALHKLSERDLIEPKFFLKDTSLSRRKLITKYGSAAIALPVILSLVAPVAAQTGSCIAVGQSCTSASQCCGFGVDPDIDCVGGVCKSQGS